MTIFNVEINGSALSITREVDGAFVIPANFRGVGTALKPAWEPIVLARKPLIGTVADNVLEHGTGALNIDGCRVGEEVRYNARAGNRNLIERNTVAPVSTRSETEGRIAVGRWPANVVHDGSDKVLACFPMAPGQQRAVGPEHGSKSSVNVYGDYGPREKFQPRGDSGSASRFFYSAKASKKDRAGSKHPTVKPVALMQWLVRMVTPPGGVVLDPFAGSGSTGEACRREGMQCVLIEREDEYAADIRRRLGLSVPAPLKLPREIADLLGIELAENEIERLLG